MKLASLRLKDFRAYVEAAIAFEEPLCIIRGGNKTGKSSLRQAIELSLTRRTDGTDPRGAGANDKVRHGSKKAIIDMTMDTARGAVEVRTSYNGTGREQKTTPPEFAGYLDANALHFSCCLDSAFFIDLPLAEQKNVLAALIAPTSYDFDPETVARVDKHLSARVWDGSPVGTIDDVYREAYDLRRDTKAKLSFLRIPELPAAPSRDSATIKQRIEDLTRDRDRLLQAKASGNNSAVVATLEADIRNAEQNLKDARLRLTTARATRDECEKHILTGASLTKIKKVAANRAKLDDLLVQEKELEREANDQTESQAIYEELRSNPCCPTCTQAITDTFIDGKIGEHKRLEEEARAKLRALVEEIAALGDVAAAEKALSLHDTHSKGKIEATKGVAEWTEKVTGYEEMLTRSRQGLENAQAESVPVDTTELDKVTAELAGERKNLEAALRYETLWTEIQVATAKQTELQAAVDDLEWICKEFGKDGLKARLIAANLEKFMDVVNATLQAFGYHASASIEPYEFIVNWENGPRLPLKELSGSEQMAFGMALQCAISIASGLRFVVIDRADTFVNGMRDAFFGVLHELVTDGALHQAIALVADERLEIPESAPGVAFYVVEDGKVRRL